MTSIIRSPMNAPVSVAQAAADAAVLSAATTASAPAAHVGSGGATHALATTSAAGFLSPEGKAKLDATTGTNTGDETQATIKSKLGITTLSGANTGDQTSVSGNAGTADRLTTPRTINGVAFDGSANIVVLPNVNNTSDADKPVSTAQAAADAAVQATAASDATAKANARQAALVSGTNIKTINGNSLLGSGDLAISAGSGGATLPRVARTSNTALTASDNSKIFSCTGTWTQTFSAAATLGSGWFCYLQNNGTGDITLDPNASELIDGLTSYIMYPGEVRLVQCDGTAFTSIVLQTFLKIGTASGTWVKPPGYQYIDGLAWGGGGSGAFYPSAASGGGGGACHPFRFLASTLPASLTYTIGAGGAGVSILGIGNTGGTTTFHTASAYGGSGGNSGTAGAGGGGGLLSAGSASAGGQPSQSSVSQLAIDNVGFGGGGIYSNGTYSFGGNAVYGGGSSGYFLVGKSVWGGGAGGSAATTAAGTSVYGGSGGAGTATGSGAAGAIPAGGGGNGYSGASGAGARGEMRIWGVM